MALEWQKENLVGIVEAVIYPWHSAAAAAKLLQSCPPLCDAVDSSPQGSAVPGILQARTLGGLPLPSPWHSIYLISEIAFLLKFKVHLNILFCCNTLQIVGFPGGSTGKESTCNVGDLDFIPGLGRSPGEGKGYPFQFSGLENSMDYIVHGVS